MHQNRRQECVKVAPDAQPVLVVAEDEVNVLPLRRIMLECRHQVERPVKEWVEADVGGLLVPEFVEPFRVDLSLHRGLVQYMVDPIV